MQGSSPLQLKIVAIAHMCSNGVISGTEESEEAEGPPAKDTQWLLKGVGDDTQVCLISITLID